MEESFAVTIAADDSIGRDLLMSVLDNFNLGVLAARVFLAVDFLYFAPGFGPRFFGESWTFESTVDDSTEIGFLFSALEVLSIRVLAAVFL